MLDTREKIQPFKPQNREELCEVLNHARETSKKVYVTSGPLDVRHVNCQCDYGITLINLEHAIKVDHNTVVVGVGVSVRKLQSVLAEHGLCLPCIPLDTDSTMGEALNTCLHASGSNVGILSSYVQEMELMTSSGETLTVGGDSELLRAASLGLGLVGVPLTVTLTATKKLPLHVTRYTIDLYQLLENFAVHCSSSDYFSCTWIPTGGCTVRHCKPATHTTCNEKSTNGALWDMFFTVYQQVGSFLSCLFNPYRLQCWNNKVLFYFGYSRNLSYVDKSGCPLASTTPGRRYYTEEWFVPRDLVPLVLYELETVIVNRRLPVHRVDVRLVRADHLYLSPTTGRDSAVISVSVNRSLQCSFVYDQIYGTINKILEQQGARPSWRTITATSYLGHLYPECYKVTAARNKLDPHQTLVSPYLRLLVQSIK